MVTFDFMDEMAARKSTTELPKDVDLTAVRGGMMAQLEQHPLLQRYVRLLMTNYPDSGGKFKCTLPWHAQGDRLSTAYLALSIGTSAGPGKPEHNGVSLALSILLAQVYLWSNPMRNMAWAMPVPRHVIAREQMPFPIMFFSYESALPISNWADVQSKARGDPPLTGDVETNHLVLIHAQDGINLFHDITSASGDDGRIEGFSIQYGLTYPTDFVEANLQPVGQILAMLAFINSPFVDTAPQRLPRTIRRELDRTGMAGKMREETSVVVLRRKVTDSRPSEDGEGREYSSRWWVSGHIRAQWYPSLKAHKLIFIAPYIKGPEDKPLKEHTYMVTR